VANFPPRADVVMTRRMSAISLQRQYLENIDDFRMINHQILGSLGR
jgi:hypothetical protein